MLSSVVDRLNQALGAASLKRPGRKVEGAELLGGSIHASHHALVVDRARQEARAQVGGGLGGMVVSEAAWIFAEVLRCETDSKVAVPRLPRQRLR